MGIRKFGKGKNSVPKIRKSLELKRVDVIQTDPYEMNPMIYEMIRDYLAAGGDEYRVGLMVPGKPYLMHFYRQYHEEYKRIKKEEAKGKDWDKLIKYVNDMESNLQVVQILKRKRKSRKSEKKYNEQFKILDDNIEYISNLIYILKPPIWIANHMRAVCPNLTPMIYHHWLAETDKVD